MDTERFSDPIQDGEVKRDNNWTRLWNRLTPTQKKIAVYAGVLVVFVLCCMIGYSSRKSTQADIAAKRPQKAEVKPIAMDNNLIEKSLYKTTTGIIGKQKEELAAMRVEIEKLRNGEGREEAEVTVPPPPKTDEKAEKETAAEKIATKQKDSVDLPPPPKVEGKSVRDKLFATVPPPPANGNGAITSQKQMIGGIEMVQQAVERPQPKADEGKKKVDSIYLPPSFMEATTLSGMAAPTTNSGKNNPLPMLLRVKTPAFLPNKVKANLRGCYVIGEGVGDLASERIHIRLKTLSCVARDGGAVIDQGIQGFVTDGDGRVGLRGKVVAKMGMHVARTALAGFISGIGEGISTSTSTQSLNTMGTMSSVLQDTNLDTIATAGFGKGISNAADSLQDFYLQLSEQTLPVIEVGSQKNITVVISVGTTLEIKEKNLKS